MSTKICGIYTITNLINNKIYVGYSSNIKKRLWIHKSSLRSKVHHNNHLQKAYNKYSEKNFVFEILEECSIEFLQSQENYWSNMLDSKNRLYGYNIKGTNPDSLSVKISEESKLKMSITRKGLIRTKEHCKNISKGKRGMIGPNKGKIHSKETKEKMRLSHINKIITQKQRLNMSISHLGKIPSNIKLIIQYSLNNKFIKEYSSIMDAARENNIIHTSIHNMLKNRSKTAGGFKWKYKN